MGADDRRLQMEVSVSLTFSEYSVTSRPTVRPQLSAKPSWRRTQDTPVDIYGLRGEDEEGERKYGGFQQVDQIDWAERRVLFPLPRYLFVDRSMLHLFSPLWLYLQQRSFLSRLYILLPFYIPR